MKDLRLPSSSLSQSFCTVTHKGGDLTIYSRDNKEPRAKRISFDPLSNPLSQKFPWKTFLYDRGLSLHQSNRHHGPVLREEEDMNIIDRLSLAWRILFPKKKVVSPAEIAKQRLKMILISDRCSVNDTAKRKIVNNIVGALADFVEIESEDRVSLNVSADPDLGTVYSVSVPVRRVKPEFQDNGEMIQDDEFREDDMFEEFEQDFESLEFPDQLDMSVSSTTKEGE